MFNQKPDLDTIRDEADTLMERVGHAVRLVTPENPLHAHTSWEVNEMLGALVPDDLSAVEMMGLAVILSGANARRLSGGPSLRLVTETTEGRRGA